MEEVKSVVIAEVFPIEYGGNITQFSRKNGSELCMSAVEELNNVGRRKICHQNNHKISSGLAMFRLWKKWLPGEKSFLPYKAKILNNIIAEQLELGSYIHITTYILK